ncbi:GDP-D-glucose phosphorylase 1-like [Haliotis cracherodii]|uniref:GDP-D-glucose phosphorylase 1-like n=1 Tax=Haliotis cracherodii TaxID=6455 RepID=UPI0039EB81C7
MADLDSFVLSYSSDDFVPQTARWGDQDVKVSKFDKELTSRWDECMEKGVFRYDMQHLDTRVVPGPKAYIAQLNSLRATERRKPQTIMSVSQSFNPDLFNFTKVGTKEILFSLQNTDDSASNGATVNGTVDSAQEPERHIIIINVSPLEYGHVLIVPQVNRCYPQVLTETSIKVGLESMLLSSHRGFRIGFNSLCAYASVNHLHMHAYYLEQQLLVEYCDVKSLGHHVHELTIMPCHGFAFQLHGTTVTQIARLIHKVTNYFYVNDIAHNLFITRGTVFGEPQSSTKRTIRMYLWPRKKFIGTKVPDEFNVAVIELAGHLPIKDDSSFHSLTEETADEIIADASLPFEEYNQIKTNVVEMAGQLDSKTQ